MFDHKIIKIAPESDLDKPILIAEKFGNDRLFTAIWNSPEIKKKAFPVYEETNEETIMTENEKCWNS
jgi:hypothetical protein